MSEQQLVERLHAGDRRALARAISIVETGGVGARSLLRAAYPHAGRAHSIGITGAPGAGKSTLVTALAQEWRHRDMRVGIIAIDPSSPFTGGAILGDRIRMQILGGDPGVFIRSMANRGRLGGIARATDDAVVLLDAAGFDIVLIETVGAGQSEVDIARTAQSTVVIEVPGMGDDVQSIKAGLLEVADIFVVNKADREGADLVMRHLRTMLHLGEHTDWQPPVLPAVATRGEGVAAIVAALHDHRVYLTTSDTLQLRAERHAIRELEAALGELIVERLQADKAVWSATVEAIALRRIDPYSAALDLVEARGRTEDTSRETQG